MRSIDADALKKAITQNRNIDRNAVCDVLDIIDNAPTTEMRQGKWTDVIYMNNTLIYGCCDQCHLPSPVSLYCGSCGAKMTAPYNSVDVADIMRTITKGQG